jgi:asparagine synthase (glutamine-hydrolysing)
MAHFALIVDPDSQRRARFLASVRERLSEWPHLVIEQRESKDLAILWATFPLAPQSWFSTDEAAGFILGDAIRDDGRRLAAADLLPPNAERLLPLPVCDGFFMLARYDAGHQMRLSVDPLGLFPLYYTATPHSLIATSSVHLGVAGADRAPELDRAGLAGILLTNGLVGERTLMRGWSRLAPGCELQWQPGETGRVEPTYRLPIHGHYTALAFDDARQLINERLSEAVRCHRPPQGTSTLLLSGGLDSRLLAGYLTAHEIADSATVWGRDSDFECRAAASVARQLQLPLVSELREPSDAEYVQAARTAAVWEHLSGGLSALETIVAAPTLGQTARYCWGGYVGDITLGGTGLQVSWDAARQQPTFEHFLANTNDWGVPFQDLGILLGDPDGTDLVHEQCEQMRREWERGNEPLSHRAVRMRLHYRVRCHISAVLHRLSMHSWPLLPFIDRKLLDAVFNVNSQFVHDRQLEHALLASRFPDLTRVALDTNSFRFEPTRNPSALRQQPWQRAISSLRRSTRTWYWQRWRGLEPRRYHRYFNPDGAYWIATRQSAEPLRSNLAHWLDPGMLERHWPPPEVKLHCSNPFSGGGALRLLIGLAFCSSGPQAPNTKN